MAKQNAPTINRRVEPLLDWLISSTVVKVGAVETEGIWEGGVEGDTLGGSVGDTDG